MPYNFPAPLAAAIRRAGRFDELTMLELARQHRADVVVHGIVTFYSPYPRPRIGLVIQAVAPAEGKVVASVDGMWDTTDQAVADRCRLFYRGGRRERLPFIRNHVIVSDDSFAGELALDSPALFRRWVSFEAVHALVGLPVPGVLTSDLNSSAVAVGGAVAGVQPPCPTPQTPAPGGNVK